MKVSAASLSVQIFVVATGIGAYHLLLAPRAVGGASRGTTTQRDAAEADGISALRRDLDSLEARLQFGSGQANSGAPAPGRIEALIARLESLEGRLIPTSADAGGRTSGHLPAGVGQPPASWTEEQVSAFRSMLEEVDRRRTIDKETAAYRDLVLRVEPNLAPADASATISLVTDFMRDIRTLFAGGSAGETSEERGATNDKARTRRLKLILDLETVLPKATVERLSQHIPTFEASSGSIPPYVTPAMDAPK